MGQRHALGLLFLVLSLVFVLIAWASAGAGQWVITVAAVALGGWMLTMSFRLLKPR